MPTGRQIRAGRALLDWDAKDLAARANLSTKTVLCIETGAATPQPASMERITQAFFAEGIEFTEHDGVRRLPRDVETFEGPERFHTFTDLVYRYLAEHGGDVCIWAVDERLFLKYRREPELYRQRMKALTDSGRVTVRILAEEGFFKSAFALFKHLPKRSDTPTSFYVFGDNLALISFVRSPSPHVVLMQTTPFAAAYRQIFNDYWDRLP